MLSNGKGGLGNLIYARGKHGYKQGCGTVWDLLIADWQIDNIHLLITSHISTIPLYCEVLNIPTLTTEAAHNMFHQIYQQGEQSNSIKNIIEQLNFHPLSITHLPLSPNATGGMCPG